MTGQEGLQHSPIKIRLAAITAIFAMATWGGHSVHAVNATDCEDTFFLCVDEPSCGTGAGCNYGDCHGTVSCLAGPGCGEGELALVCNFAE